MTLVFAPANADSIPVHLLPSDGFADWLDQQDQGIKEWVANADFTAAHGRG